MQHPEAQFLQNSEANRSELAVANFTCKLHASRAEWRAFAVPILQISVVEVVLIPANEGIHALGLLPTIQIGLCKVYCIRP